jgi:hypothetical protein
MLMIQAPGSFLVSYFQGVQYRESVSTWLPFFVTGIEQVILLILCIIFLLKKRIHEKKQRKWNIQESEEKPLFQ